MAAPMLEFRTPGFNPYAVQYSPYYDSRAAVASSANYGIIGNGKLFVIELTAAGVQLGKSYDTNDAQFDLAWSELNENQVLVACGDGSLKLFDLAVDDFPVMSFHEHKREALSVSWSPVTKDTFLTSSWDGTVKLWSPTRNQALRTLPIGHCTYSAAYCPSNPAVVSAASSDSLLRIFDLRTPVSAKYHLVASIPVHAPPSAPLPPAALAAGLPPALATAAPPAEILTHDWNKYNDNVVATGGVDKVIRTFDIRNPAGGPLSLLLGHEFAVRRLAWSPHAHDVLASASYDMSVRVWTDGSLPPAPMSPPPPQQQLSSVRLGAQLGLMNRHTEFTTGIDWCLFGEGGWVASAGWDERVLLWDTKAFIHR